MSRLRCRICGYVYDEERGEPSTGVVPGTKFDSLPDDWRCPVCRAGKGAFDLIRDEDYHQEAMTTVSDVLVAELEAWGITTVFGLPGTSSLGLVDALRKNANVQYIVVRHEESAAMAASAYNKLTGKMAACLTIAGPGATNLATGLYDAKEDGASVLSLNGQVAIQYTGPGGIQEIDQDAFFRPITVFNNTIYDKKVAVLLLTRALKYAILHRGVAQLSIPNDIQKEPLTAEFCHREGCITDLHILPRQEQLDIAADAINRSERPVIIAGWGAFPHGAEVATLAQRIGAPILTTFRAKGILPDAHEWVMGILGNVGSPHARMLASSADLLITLGVGFSRFTNVPEDKPLVQLDIDPVRLARNPSSVPLWGNCSLVLPALISRVTKRETADVLQALQQKKREWELQLEKEADPNAVPIRPPFIMKTLSDLIPDDAIISLDVGENQWWFGRNFRIKHQRFAMSGYLATMGFGLPGAIAAKIAYPKRQVFCITGDGGFAMVMAEFVTAVKYELPMVVVILNNHQLGMIQVEQMMERYINFGTELFNPDFAKYAEACGGKGLRVTIPQELAPAIRTALNEDKPVIVDVETDPKRF